MERSRTERLEELFAVAMELHGLCRTDFVERVAAGDHELREELIELLEIQASGLDGFLAKPVVGRPREGVDLDSWRAAATESMEDRAAADGQSPRRQP